MTRVVPLGPFVARLMRSQIRSFWWVLRHAQREHDNLRAEVACSTARSYSSTIASTFPGLRGPRASRRSSPHAGRLSRGAEHAHQRRYRRGCTPLIPASRKRLLITCYAAPRELLRRVEAARAG